MTSAAHLQQAIGRSLDNIATATSRLEAFATVAAEGVEAAASTQAHWSVGASNEASGALLDAARGAIGLRDELLATAPSETVIHGKLLDHATRLASYAGVADALGGSATVDDLAQAASSMGEHRAVLDTAATYLGETAAQATDIDAVLAHTDAALHLSNARGAIDLMDRLPGASAQKTAFDTVADDILLGRDQLRLAGIDDATSGSLRDAGLHAAASSGRSAMIDAAGRGALPDTGINAGGEITSIRDDIASMGEYVKVQARVHGVDAG